MDNVRYSNIYQLDSYIEETKHIQHTHLQSEDGIPLAFATNLHETADAISRIAQIEEFMFLGLRMTDGITREEFASTFGMQIEAIYGDVLPTLVAQKLIEQKAGQIRLTKRGTDISNYVLAQFLLG
jgi:oxygen-independent coproporphyrinogen-3 oxidase